MAQASASIDIAVPPDRVWQLIGGFNSLPDWLPYIPKSEMGEGGRVRHLVNPDGQTIVERLEAFDHAGRSYSYSILKGLGLPVHALRATNGQRQAVAREMVWSVHAQRGERPGGLSAVSVHLRGWPQGAGRQLRIEEKVTSSGTFSPGGCKPALPVAASNVLENRGGADK